jgi:putative effector of murein hydrolase
MSSTEWEIYLFGWAITLFAIVLDDYRKGSLSVSSVLMPAVIGLALWPLFLLLFIFERAGGSGD